ncbi:amidohydrolase family protein [Subtercola lobariae]|uniref:Amidohydrolase n=1 Tax=Subtercola lobariae TaxID=1588641 RepID=A0A917BAP1_9MICO|nr:amidohydrolase family protein [Subtercola lobariae]GGF34833.1 amidohydrolase [Subtercola lobariae]
MSLIALEEHLFTNDINQRLGGRLFPGFADRLDDVGEQRLAAMDAAGIDLQVLSFPSHEIQEAETRLSIELAHDANDQLAAVVAQRPDRFQAFAALPLSDVDASIRELRRSILDLGFVGPMLFGQTHGHFLDEPQFEPLWAEIEALDVPVYLHPAEPPTAVRDAYYSNIDASIARALERGAWGWHAELGMHVLRLAASGTLERHRSVQLIVGHMGENLPFSLQRASDQLGNPGGLPRNVMQTVLDQVAITMAGYPYEPALLCALLVFGADNILFSVDYPFASNVRAADALAQAPLSPLDREKIASGNARRILNLR